MTSQKLNPPAIAAPVGAYSHGVLAPATGQWLHVSGQIGVRPDGSLGSGFAEQARLAWENLLAVLAAAHMDASHLVKVTTFMTEAGDLKDLNPVRSAFLGEARPASTLLIVKALARPEWLFEVEAVAYRA
ncbi:MULTISPECIES: RidA family protein [Polaromonas]|uniref:RidA family protein n=1 Tax=Polaromonas aquatica TaxID=332657 RepID=A0ABW1TX91_9BURK